MQGKENLFNERTLVQIQINGDSGVGKSCMLLRGVEGTYTEQLILTIGHNIKIKEFKVDEKTVKAQIWDIAGKQPQNKNRRRRQTDVMILAYDITDRKSFDNITSWKNQLDYESSDTIFILVGNKSDLDSQRQVSQEEAEQFSKSTNCHAFIECSAKTGINVDEVFMRAVCKVIEREKLQEKDKSLNKPVTPSLVLNTAAMLTGQRLCTAGVVIFIIGALAALVGGAWIGMAALGVVGAAALITKALLIAGGATLGLGGVLGAAGLFQKYSTQVTTPSDLKSKLAL